MSELHEQVARLLEVGRAQEAGELLARALSESPESASIRVLSARVALLQGDVEEARTQVGRALSLEPTSFEARWLLYALERQADRHAQAEEVLTELLREYPEAPDLLAEYGSLMLETLHLEKARQLTDEALRLDPENRSARATDSLLALCEGNRERAGHRVAELIGDDPDSREAAYTLLAHLVEERRTREALELSQELLRIDPKNEHLLEAIVELRMATHPLALPLRPLQRFGWAGSAAIWFGAIVVLRWAGRAEVPWALPLAGLYLAWVLYSWIYPPLMKRWLRARGL